MGARWYDPLVGRFVQPDTITPNPYNPQSLNRFSYGLNNPVKYTDPTGHIACEDEDIEDCLPEPPIPPPPVPPDPPEGGDPADPWAVGWEWLTGQGPRHHEFRDDDPFTEMLKTHAHIAEVRAEIADRIARRDYRAGIDDYDLSGWEGVPKYAGDYANVVTLGHTGNLAVTFLGSYKLDFYIVSVDRHAGTAEVLINVENVSNIASATHPPVLGYTDVWRENVEPRVNALTKSGPMSPVTQSFWWKEIIPFK